VILIQVPVLKHLLNVEHTRFHHVRGQASKEHDLGMLRMLTIKKCLFRIFEKLGVSTRVELVLMH
jgi:hypothetical protein